MDAGSLIILFILFFTLGGTLAVLQVSYYSRGDVAPSFTLSLLQQPSSWMGRGEAGVAVCDMIDGCILRTSPAEHA